MRARLAVPTVVAGVFALAAFGAVFIALVLARGCLSLSISDPPRVVAAPPSRPGK